MADLSLLSIDLGPGVRAGFSTRAGGASSGAWLGLDLGLHVGDDPATVARNRQSLAARVGAPVWFGRQVHGTRVVLVDGAGGGGAGTPGPADPFGADLGQDDGGYDALVADAVGVAVGVLVADCVPVLLADPVAGVAAAAHAGRKGLLDGVLTAALAAMRRSGARPGRIRAALGPSAGGCCYEVPQQLSAQACATLPELRAETTWGTPSLDLRAGCRAVLERAGVGDVRLVGGCTIEDDTFYSYRRAPVTGRFAGVVMMSG